MKGTTISSIQLPLSEESIVMIPKGKVLGVYKYTRISVDINTPMNHECLNVSVMHEIGAELQKVSFYVSCEPVVMTKTDSIGRYFGSFTVQGGIYHVFKQLYKDES